MQLRVLVNVGRGGELDCVALGILCGDCEHACVRLKLNCVALGSDRTCERYIELNLIANAGRCVVSSERDGSQVLRDGGDAGSLFGREHDSGHERRNGVDAPMVQVVVAAHGLGVVDRIRLVHGVTALEEVLGGEQRNALLAGERELVNEHLANLHVSLFEVEHGSKGVNVNRRIDLGRGHEYEFGFLGENGQVLHANTVVDGGREHELVCVGADSLQELLASRFIGGNAGQVVLVEAELLFIEGDQLEHDSVLIVLVSVHGLL